MNAKNSLGLFSGYNFHCFALIVCWPPVGPQDTKRVSKYNAHNASTNAPKGVVSSVLSSVLQFCGLVASSTDYIQHVLTPSPPRLHSHSSVSRYGLLIVLFRRRTLCCEGSFSFRTAENGYHPLLTTRREATLLQCYELSQLCHKYVMLADEADAGHKPDPCLRLLDNISSNRMEGRR